MAPRALRSRWWTLVEQLRASLWAMPVSLMLGAIALAAVTLTVDRNHGRDIAEAWWVLEAGTEGTRATLSALASSVMTVAGVSFSMTIVVLQLASSQYSPRVIRSFRRDRLLQLVLGAFTGTFIHALIVLRTIASSEEGPSFTAPVSVSVSMLLGIMCMVLLVALVHHVAREVQVSTILGGIAEETRGTLERLYPEQLGRAEDGRRVEDASPAEAIPERMDPPWSVTAPRDGYVQYVDGEALAGIEEAELVRVEVQVGDFAREGECLARVWPAEAERCTANGDIHAAFAMGSERTMRQDLRYGVRLVVDVALRALSPSLNDPGTALHCVDVLSALLVRLVQRRVPHPMRRGRGGVRIYALRPSFADVLLLAYAEIVAAAATQPPVERAVVAALSAIAAHDPEGRHRGAIGAVAARVRHELAHAGWPESDCAALRDALDALDARLAATAGRPPSAHT
jgi:uncharacterized membrane protein